MQHLEVSDAVRHIYVVRQLRVNSDLSVLTDCNKTGGTIKADIKKSSQINGHLFVPISVFDW